ncbi:Glutathione S-transferase 1 [Tropilaelaps mercedesae]|uniref:Glutathione S-transferase 1 n=1 Tax=Tropilaelaps mercedesae TaxID=418985 RepID=A0A1V9XS70_9ACAR|nr:Glutathione S-transferase 1 [Tropilaelaps mercedesae]
MVVYNESLYRISEQSQDPTIAADALSNGSSIGEANGLQSAKLMVFMSAACRATRLVARTIGVECSLKETNLLAGDQMKPEFIKWEFQNGEDTVAERIER